MPDFDQLKTWIAPLLGSGAVGFVARYLWDCWIARQQNEQSRGERLEQLDRLLTESGNLFHGQVTKAKRLVELIKTTHPNLVVLGKSYDQVFAEAFDNFTAEELQLHTIIRTVTDSALRVVNVEMAEWLKKDNWYIQSKHRSETLNELASLLQTLQAHLADWQAKLVSVFAKDKKLAMSFVADEQKQGVGFPKGIENVVKRALRGGT